MANSAPITIKCGKPWWVSFLYRDSAGVPQVLTEVKMEIRTREDTTGSILFTSEGDDPSIILDYTDAPLIRASIPPAASANRRSGEGYWDAFGLLDGELVEICPTSPATIIGNVSKL